ncbi:hypothetical protein, partial [Exiguobacterium mexicanum]|uniref:hypothetical protein n=1 Tax=Exiguobacterium mexicanum TaxID=340146 RepID=UPI0035E4238E
FLSSDLSTGKKLEGHLHKNLHPEATIHLDQRFRYTHPAYQSRFVGTVSTTHQSSPSSGI